MKRWIVAGVCFLLFMMTVGGSWLYIVHTPQYSLWHLKNALREHDLATFEKYFDIQSVSGDMVDQALAKTSSESEQSRDEWGEMGQKFAENLMALLKPRLVEAVSDQFKKLVESGDYESASGAERPLFNLSVFERDSVFKGVDFVKKSGKIAKVGIRVHPENEPKEFILEVEMRDKGSYWQVFKIDNIFDLPR